MVSKAEITKAERIGWLMDKDKSGHQFIHFKGGDLMSGPHTNGFIPFDARLFGRLVQSRVPGVSENMIADFAKTVRTLADDWSDKAHLIEMGGQIWDMNTLDFVTELPDGWVYSTKITPQPHGSKGYLAAQEFFLQLADGDADLAYDYQQAIAPLFMTKRPVGMIWFWGSGANGKSSLLDALYAILGPYFASLDTSKIEDGKAIPALRGKLGNIVREGSEARIENSQNYKAIGSHEDLEVRMLYTNDVVTVPTDFHTIFNANNIPTFQDKTHAITRRTETIPFPAHFKDDPTFEDRTFTPEFLGGMLTLFLEAAQKLRDNHYRYDWSGATQRVKAVYDSEANSADAFVAYMEDMKFQGFSNWGILHDNYEFWCRNEGLYPLGLKGLKSSMKALNPTKKTVSDGGKNYSRFLFDGAKPELEWVNGYAVLRATPDALDKATQQLSNERLSSEW